VEYKTGLKHSMEGRTGLWLGQLTKEELARLDGVATGERVTVRGEKFTLEFSDYYRQFYLDPFVRPKYAH